MLGGEEGISNSGMAEWKEGKAWGRGEEVPPSLGAPHSQLLQVFSNAEAQ